MQRRLVAILAADVVGYSRLMGEDEVGTLDALKALRKELVVPKITKHQGRVVKLMGDGLIAEFGSIVNTVECAVAIQSSMPGRNNGVVQERQILLRIGINLGDIIVEGSDIYGDGVNVASRLESLSDSGGICISDMVYQNVKGKLDLSFMDIGFQKVKNIAEPIHAYQIVVHAPTSVSEPLDDQSQAISDKPSIAVLPFENMSGDPEQEYFSDGVTEDIITELSRFGDLFVIARNSSFVFKNQSVDIADIGKKLGAQYVVEGSVRKSGNKVRVTAQLIDASTGNHIWADRYDRDLKDVFLVQDEVVRIITSTLVGRVAYAHVGRAKQNPTSNQDAYDWFIQGRELFYNGTAEENSKACAMFEKAVSLDPNYAAAYALLGETYLRDWLTFWNNPPEISCERAWENAKKSLTLDDMDSRTHTALGVVNLFVGDIGQANLHLDRALTLNPGDTHSLVYMSRYEMATGDSMRALDRINEARRNNPFGKYSFSLVPIYYALRRYEEAIQVMRAVQNPSPSMLPWMAAVYSQSGETENARYTLSKFIAITTEKLTASGTPIPESWLGFITDRWRLVHDDTREHFLDGLHKAGIRD